MTLELDLEMLLQRPSLTPPFWIDPKLLELSSMGRLEANPKRLSLVAELVPYLEEELLGRFPDQQSDRLDMNTNSSKWRRAASFSFWKRNLSQAEQGHVATSLELLDRSG